MAERDDSYDEPDTGRRPARFRFPDPITLFIGLITLGVSGWVLSDGNWGLPDVDPRWLVAGGALLIGLLLLGASLRPRGGRRR